MMVLYYREATLRDNNTAFAAFNVGLLFVPLNTILLSTGDSENRICERARVL